MFLIPLKVKDELGYTRTLRTKEEQLAFHIKNEIITNTTDGAAREIANKITNGHFINLLKYEETQTPEPTPDPNWQDNLRQLSADDLYPTKRARDFANLLSNRW